MRQSMIKLRQFRTYRGLRLDAESDLVARLIEPNMLMVPADIPLFEEVGRIRSWYASLQLGTDINEQIL
jgi:hypothetical protein